MHYFTWQKGTNIPSENDTNQNFTEQYCKWVSSQGIAKSCDFYVSNQEDYQYLIIHIVKSKF